MLTCAGCSYGLSGERQKGHIYYRCHTRSCPITGVGEDAIHGALWSRLFPLELSVAEAAELEDQIAQAGGELAQSRDELVHALDLKLKSVESRLARLTDAYLDEAVDRAIFEQKKLSLLLERKSLEDQRRLAIQGDPREINNLRDNFELLKMVPLTYGLGNPDENREIVKTLTSDLLVQPKNVVVKLHSPFEEIANIGFVRSGGALRRRLRTVPRSRVPRIFRILTRHAAEQAKEAECAECPASLAV